VFNRRWFMKPGFELKDPLDLGADKVRMNPPPGHPALDRPAGPVDPEVCLLSIQASDGRAIALLANYALHYVGGVPDGTLSADYFGEFARCITRRIGAENVEPPFVGIMSNGTSGNVNNINFREPRPPSEPFEQIQTVASAVADTVFEAYQRIEYQEWVPLRMREREIELGVRLPTETEVAQAKKRLETAGPELPSLSAQEYARETVLLAEYPARVAVKLQAIRIGGLGIVSSPCETFVETGLAIKRASPLKPTFTIELANGYNGYLPTPEQHRLGGYETWRARSSYLEVDAATKIQSTLLGLLGEVASHDK
jgi:neutral ceramidase